MKEAKRKKSKLLGLALPLIVSCFALSSMVASAKDKAASVKGYYFAPEKKGIVRIYQGKDGKVYGKIVWEKEKRGHLGHLLMRHFVLEDDQWEDGRICPPDKDQCLKAKLWKEGPHVKVRGFKGVSLFGKTMTLKRVTKKNAPPGFRP